MNKQFTLRIDMKNAAFDDEENGLCELYNILNDLRRGIKAKYLWGGPVNGYLGEWGVIHDTNGNPVGQWHFKRTRKS